MAWESGGRGCSSRASPPGLQPPQISAFVREIFQDRSGDFWFGTNGDGICRHDAESLTFFGPDEGFGGSAVRGMHEDRNGDLWFGTDGEGVHRWDGATFTSFRTGDGLAGDRVRSIEVGRRVHIWIGTDGGGVSRFDGTSFQNFTRKAASKTTVSTRSSRTGRDTSDSPLSTPGSADATAPRSPPSASITA